MKRILLALLAAALIALLSACALAQEIADPTAIPQAGAAATRGTAQLLAAPLKSAKVLMTYYPGVRVQVVRQADAEYVQVNVGNRPATLTGYMRAEDLAFTEQGVRGVAGVWATCSFDEPPTVYSAMDALSQEQGRMQSHYLVLGVSADGWMHVLCGSGEPEDATGFAYRGGDAGGMELALAPYVFTLPTQGEVSVEDAIAYARRQIVEDGQLANGTGEPVTTEGLDACEAHVRVLYYAGEALSYTVTFRDESGAIYAFINLYVEGDEVLFSNYGNG